MDDILFIVFAVLTLGSSLFVVLSRNTVTAALLVVLAFVGVAGLFTLLNATFLAALQVLVYAGAVMVLFLFIVMLLDVDKAARTLPKKIPLVIASCALLAMVVGVTYLFVDTPDLPSPSLQALGAPDTPFAFPENAKVFGYALFTKYLLPLQTVGFLLLMAMVGVVVLSKPYKEEAELSEEIK